MSAWQDHTIPTHFADENSCIAYLFAKRWPWGFTCPVCGTLQKDMLPAAQVVCRFCRRQTSITAHTLMHGSKKSLAAWLLVANQFCEQSSGISSRELQRLLGLSCYQTAWSWLSKLRRGAARAEAAPCRGVVLFDLAEPTLMVSANAAGLSIGIALELKQKNPAASRIRMTVVDCRCPDEIVAAIKQQVLENSTLLVRAEKWKRQLSGLDSLAELYLVGHPTSEQLNLTKNVLDDFVRWLNSVYRGAIDSRYLQDYLDEYSFRHNTASWQDRRAILDHLLTGLISPAGKMRPVPAGLRAR